MTDETRETQQRPLVRVWDTGRTKIPRVSVTAKLPLHIIVGLDEMAREEGRTRTALIERALRAMVGEYRASKVRPAREDPDRAT